MKDCYKALIPTGVRMGRGRREGNRETGFRNYYEELIPTASGEIEENRWFDLCEQAIKDNGDDGELNNLMEYLADDPVSARQRSPKKALKRKCIELFMDDIQNSPEWIWYVSYNSKYHPEKLDNVELVNYFTECCGIGSQTKAVFERDLGIWTERCHCHTCGRLTEFKEV